MVRTSVSPMIFYRLFAQAVVLRLPMILDTASGVHTARTAGQSPVPPRATSQSVSPYRQRPVDFNRNAVYECLEHLGTANFS